MFISEFMSARILKFEENVLSPEILIKRITIVFLFFDFFGEQKIYMFPSTNRHLSEL